MLVKVGFYYSGLTILGVEPGPREVDAQLPGGLVVRKAAREHVPIWPADTPRKGVGWDSKGVVLENDVGERRVRT